MSNRKPDINGPTVAEVTDMGIAVGQWTTTAAGMAQPVDVKLRFSDPRQQTPPANGAPPPVTLRQFQGGIYPDGKGGKLFHVADQQGRAIDGLRGYMPQCYPTDGTSNFIGTPAAIDFGTFWASCNGMTCTANVKQATAALVPDFTNANPWVNPITKGSGVACWPNDFSFGGPLPPPQ